MKYLNSKTGYMLETECEVSGGDWRAVQAKTTPPPEEQPPKEHAPTQKPAGTRRAKR